VPAASAGAAGRKFNFSPKKQLTVCGQLVEYQCFYLELAKEMLDSQKDKWAEEQARRLQKRFEQWQKPLGIDGDEYVKYLRGELFQSCEDPLMKDLIESIS